MTEGHSYDVFLSYAAADRAWVSEFGRALREAGVDSFFDVSDLPPGTPWNDELLDALRASRTVVVIISARSVRSEWLFFEIGAAVADNKRIIPVVTEEVDPQLLPALLRNYAALKEPSATEAGRRVAEAICRVPAE